MAFYLVVDTETANSLDDPLVYDCGWAIIDEEGTVYLTRSYVNADIFCKEAEMMENAYFAEKIGNYWEEIKSGQRILTNFYNIRKQFREDCATFQIMAIMAHNARFDYIALSSTQRWLTKSKYRYFLPYGVEVWDTLKMARNVFSDDEEYTIFCQENGYLTKFGKPQMTAEVIHRYLTKNTDFAESHTALEDVMIEKDIFSYCWQKGCRDCALW